MVFSKETWIHPTKCSFSHDRGHKGNSREKIYFEVGLEWLWNRRWYENVCFYKILNSMSVK